MMNNEHITNFENLTALLIESKRANVLPQECYPAIQQWYEAQTGHEERERLGNFAHTIERNEDLADWLEQKENGLTEYFCRAVKDYDLTSQLLGLRQI